MVKSLTDVQAAKTFDRIETELLEAWDAELGWIADSPDYDEERDWVDRYFQGRLDMLRYVKQELFR